MREELLEIRIGYFNSGTKVTFDLEAEHLLKAVTDALEEYATSMKSEREGAS